MNIFKMINEIFLKFIGSLETALTGAHPVCLLNGN